jgi:hypothetical protein
MGRYQLINCVRRRNGAVASGKFAAPPPAPRNPGIEAFCHTIQLPALVLHQFDDGPHLRQRECYTARRRWNCSGRQHRSRYQGPTQAGAPRFSPNRENLGPKASLVLLISTELRIAASMLLRVQRLSRRKRGADIAMGAWRHRRAARSIPYRRLNSGAVGSGTGVTAPWQSGQTICGSPST